MPDLHGWITHQIDKTEAVARAATPGPWTARPVIYGPPEDGWGDPSHFEIGSPTRDVIGHQPHEGGGIYHGSDAQHIALHDPANVLRRCQADRKILESHAPQGGDWEPYACLGCGTDSEYGVLVEHTNDCETLQALAGGYGLTEEQRAQLDRPEPEPRQRRMGGFLGAGIAEAMYGDLIATFINARPVEPRPEVKAIKILEPELKRIALYAPISGEGPRET